ncbi:hypothetical protein FP828_07710 [bacterium]|nr:hypothetical protein [bacterium]
MKKLLVAGITISLLSSCLFSNLMAFDSILQERKTLQGESGGVGWGVFFMTIGSYLAVNGIHNQGSTSVRESFRLSDPAWGTTTSGGNWLSYASGIIENTGNVPVTVNMRVSFDPGDTSSVNATLSPGQQYGWTAYDYSSTNIPANVSLFNISATYGSLPGSEDDYATQIKAGFALTGLGLYMVLNHYVKKTQFAKKHNLEIQTAACPGYYRLALAKRF